jgi:hypothetical protein
MRYFTWTEYAGPARPGTGPPWGRARRGPRERVLDEICCLEMT